MPYREPVQFDLKDTLDGVTSLMLLTPQMKPGDVWYVEEIMIYVSTTNTADVKIGTYDGSTYTWFESLLNIGADEYTLAHLRMTLTTYQRVAIHFMNCVDGEQVRAAVNGYIFVTEPARY